MDPQAADPPVAAITYTVTARNEGSDSALGVLVRQELPESVRLLSVTTQQGNWIAFGQNIEFSIGSLAQSQQTTMVVTAKPLASGSIVSTATVRGVVSDSDPTDDVAIGITEIRKIGCDLFGEVGSVRLLRRQVGRRLREMVTGTITVRNKGDSSVRRLKITYYLSDDEEVGDGDLSVLSQNVETLRANGDRVVSFLVSVPPTVSANGKFLLARIDPQDRIPEDSESNNTIVLGPLEE